MKVLDKIRWQWLTISLGISNLWRFRKVVWRFDRCDYAHLLQLISFGAKEIASHHKEHPIVTDADRIAKELTIVSELCRRLADDDYFLLASGAKDWLDVRAMLKGMNSKQKSRIFAHQEYLAKQDVAYLGKAFKRVRCWWS